jgi:hypothetical protein
MDGPAKKLLSQIYEHNHERVREVIKLAEMMRDN